MMMASASACHGFSSPLTLLAFLIANAIPPMVGRTKERWICPRQPVFYRFHPFRLGMKLFLTRNAGQCLPGSRVSIAFLIPVHFVPPDMQSLVVHSHASLVKRPSAHPSHGVTESLRFAPPRRSNCSSSLAHDRASSSGTAGYCAPPCASYRGSERRTRCDDSSAF